MLVVTYLHIELQHLDNDCMLFEYCYGCIQEDCFHFQCTEGNQAQWVHFQHQNENSEVELQLHIDKFLMFYVQCNLAVHT